MPGNITCNLTSCLCHKEGISGPISLFTDKSWKTFRTAADIYRDDPYVKLCDVWDNGPTGGYHRQCYQSYTNKDHLSRIQRKRGTSQEEDPPTKLSKRQPREDAHILKNECIICQVDKYDKDKKNLERLNLCQQYSSATNVLEAAKIEQNDRIIRELLDKDPIAIELRYHHSCYLGYTSSIRRSTNKIPKLDESQSSAYSDVYDTAFNIIADKVTEKVIEGHDVCKMTELRDEYVALLTQNDIESPVYRTYKLKARLQKKFGSQLSFWRPQYRCNAEIVFSNCIPKGHYAEEAMGRGPDEMDSDDEPVAEQVDYSELFHSAKSLRTELKNIKPQMSEPPKASDLISDKIILPTMVFNFLVWILTEDATLIDIDTEKISVRSDVQRRIHSIGQDLLYCTSNGRVKTPKHVSLAMAVKNLTGSSQLVTLINRFGHSISYNELLEMEVCMAQDQIMRQKEGILLPSNINKFVFSTLCWDNNDLNEQTLSGSGTTHCTNGIIVQRQVHTCQPPPAPVAEYDNINIVSLSRSIPFVTQQRSGPQMLNVNSDLFKLSMPDAYIDARKTDLGWFLLRLPITAEARSIFSVTYETEQKTKNWSAFNAELRQNDIPPKSIVGYCNTIDASPTEISTVNTILKRSLLIADHLGQNDVVVVLDQAIYCKAKEIIWSNPNDFQRVVLRMGTFHITCNFLGVLGKRYGGAGLSDLLIECLAVAPGSLAGVLSGHHYNRAVRAHKIMYEALMRAQWDEFGSWLELNPDRHHFTDTDVGSLKTALINMKEDFQPVDFTNLLSGVPLVELSAALVTFATTDRGPMAKFWQSYLDLAGLLLTFIRATREGNWELHIACLQKMLPWMFASDHTNYSRYLTLYWWDMHQLHTTHPEVNTCMQMGEFAVQRCSQKPFSQLPVDQTIEQTVNRDSKTPGGIVGFSLNKAATQRWIITAHERAAMTERCRELAGIDSTGTAHKESSKERTKKDEACVQHIVSYLDEHVNPFEESDSLIHLTSGLIASQDVTDDLLDAEQIGMSALEKFTAKRLNSNTEEFHAPLKKLQLKTFDSMQLNDRKPTRQASTKSDRDLFARLLVVAQNRHMNIQEVLSFELGDLPLSLASTDGTLCKTPKSKLSHLLEKSVSPMQQIPSGTALLVDAMVLLHSIKPTATFAELADKVMGIVLCQASEHSNITRIDLVCDSYRAISIKNTERSQRAQRGSLRVKINKADQKCPLQWQKFMANSDNKEELVTFLRHEWSSDRFATQLNGLILYITSQTECHQLVSSNGHILSHPVKELFSCHEEADVRLMLHAHHASQQGHAVIYIRSIDTDVQVLALFHQRSIQARILLVTGTRKRQHVIDIQSLAASSGIDVCNAIIGLHAFTGCDSTSAFNGKGKKLAFDLLERNQKLNRAMQLLGASFNVTDELHDLCEQFAMRLYTADAPTINEQRYILFCTRNLQSQQLPPTRDALRKHVARANYQAAIWKLALDAQPNIPSPDGHGWSVVDDTVVISWKDNGAAPHTLLSLTKCGCKTPCATNRCSCRSSNMSCTVACRCAAECDNHFNKQIQECDTSDISDTE